MKSPSSSRSLPGPVRAWSRFWLTPVHPAGLNALRVLGGLLFLGWLLGFAGHQQALFGLDGWFDSVAYREAARLPDGTPAPVSWSLVYLTGLSPALLQALYWGSLAVLALFTLGIATRVTAVMTWLIVGSFLANPATSYDADYLLALLAVYLMIGHLLLGQWSRKLSLPARLLGTRGRSTPSRAAGMTIRLIQVHFAVVIVVSGLHKLQFGDWWSGVAYWYPLNPPFEVTRASLRSRSASASSYLSLLSLIQYVALTWQLAFPLFAWRRSWRPVLLIGAVAGWIGSLVVYRQPVFGPVLVIACLSYLTPEEWQRVAGWRDRLVALLRRRHPDTVPQGGPVHV